MENELRLESVTELMEFATEIHYSMNRERTGGSLDVTVQPPAGRRLSDLWDFSGFTDDDALKVAWEALALVDPNDIVRFMFDVKAKHELSQEDGRLGISATFEKRGF